MIAGYINKAGVKEDQLIKRLLPQETQDFDQILNPRAGSEIKRSYPKSQESSKSDPRSRKDYGRDREEFAARKEDPGRLPDSPPAGAGSHQIHQNPDPSDPEEIDYSIHPSSVQTLTNGDIETGKAAGRASIMAQLGSAAYGISAHGKGEGVLAEEMGLFPPGSASPSDMPLGKMSESFENSALFIENNPAATLEEGINNKPMSAVDVLNFSRKATNKNIIVEEAMMEQAQEQNHKTYQDVVYPTGKDQDSILPTGLAAQETNAKLNQKLQGFSTPADGGSKASDVMQPSTAEATAPTISLNSNKPGYPGIIAAESANNDNQSMVERIAIQARWVLKNHRSEVTFQLHPKHLGNLKLKVTQEDRTLRVEMLVDNISAKQLIESQLNDLQARLQAENPDTKEFNFNVDVRQGNDPNQSENTSVSKGNNYLANPTGHLENDSENIGAERNRPRWGIQGVGVYA